MNQYMLLLYSDPKQEMAWTPEEMQAVVREYSAWAGELGGRGALTGGEKLTDEGGRSLEHRGDDCVVTEGPYAEAREVLGGFFMIRAASYDDAVAIARTCPHARHGMRTEVRQIECCESPEDD